MEKEMSQLLRFALIPLAASTISLSCKPIPKPKQTTPRQQQAARSTPREARQPVLYLVEQTTERSLALTPRKKKHSGNEGTENVSPNPADTVTARSRRPPPPSIANLEGFFKLVKVKDATELADASGDAQLGDIVAKPRARTAASPTISYNELLLLHMPDLFPDDADNDYYIVAPKKGTLKDIIQEHRPVDIAWVQDKPFYLSKILEDEESPGRSMMAMYTYDSKNRLVARLLWHSNSSGVWRVAPFLQDELIFKGNFHYTLETQLATEITQKIALMEAAKEQRQRYFRNLSEDGPVFSNLKQSFDMRFNPGLDAEFEGEHSKHDLGQDYQRINDCKPGSCFETHPSNAKNWGTFLSQLTYPEGFLPTFKDPPKISDHIHPIVGQYRAYVFSSKLNNREVHWRFCVAKERINNQPQIWIERTHFADSKVTSFGTYSDILNTGPLANKVIEYQEQAKGLAPAEFDNLPNKWGADYISLAPLLANLKPIKDFKAWLESQKP